MASRIPVVEGGSIALIGGRASVRFASCLVSLGVPITVVANTGSDSADCRPDLDAFSGTGVRAVPVTDEPNPTTVVVKERGELPAAEWISDGRTGKLLAVRLSGCAQADPKAVDAISGAAAVILGPDDGDIVIDPVLKVLAQSNIRLPKPVLAVGHGHHRFEGTADIMIEVNHDPAEQARAVLATLRLTFAEQHPHV